jgi:hypothetical protein
LLCPLLAFAAARRRELDTIDYNTVAVEDKLIDGYDNIGNSDAAEGDFLIDYMVTNYGYDESSPEPTKRSTSAARVRFVEVANEVDGSNLLAIDFSAFGITDPVVFLVKVGNAVYEHYPLREPGQHAIRCDRS